MKILFITPSLSKLWGGTTAAVLNLFYALRTGGADIELWSTRRDDDEISDDVAQDLKIRFFDSHTSWRYSSSMGNALSHSIGNFDIVHIHGMWLYPHFAAAKAAKKLNIPYVISPHGMVEAEALARKGLKKRVYWSLLERANFQNASAIHAITQNEKNQISILASPKIVFVLPNGVKVQLHNLKNSFPSTPLVLFIGRLHPIKGLDGLLRATAALDIRLVVAGDGDSGYKKYIHGLVKELSIGDRVDFLGFVCKEQKIDLYAKASFICVPSHSEVLSLVALEAITYGMPIVVSRSCHFDDIEKFGAGVVIKDNKPDTIARAVVEMLSSDLHTMSQNAFMLSQKYSIINIASALLLEYKKILRKR